MAKKTTVSLRRGNHTDTKWLAVAHTWRLFDRQLHQFLNSDGTRWGWTVNVTPPGQGPRCPLFRKLCGLECRPERSEAYNLRPRREKELSSLATLYSPSLQHYTYHSCDNIRQKNRTHAIHERDVQLGEQTIIHVPCSQIIHHIQTKHHLHYNS